MSCHHSVDLERVGCSRPVDDPTIPIRCTEYTAVFADSVCLMADAFGLELDEVPLHLRNGRLHKDVDLGWCQLPKVSLGGNFISYQGVVDGVTRIRVEPQNGR